MTKNIPTVSHQLDNELTFYASKKAPKQRKKRDKHARYIYNLVVTLGINLFEQGLMHPKMPELKPAHYETIVHNIGRLCADEITSLNKFNLTGEVPLLMDQCVKHTIKGIVKDQNRKTNKSTVSMAKKKATIKKVSRQASKSK